MTTLLTPISEQNVGPIPGIDEDVEPDTQWKEGLRARIEKELQSMADKVRQERDAQLRGVPEGSMQWEGIMRTYNANMDRVRRMAQEQYSHELKVARFERSLALGKEIEGEEFEAFKRQQQAIWEAIKKGGSERTQGRRDSSVSNPAQENERETVAASPARPSGEQDHREGGPGMSYRDRDSRPLSRAPPQAEPRPRDRTQSGGSDQVLVTPGSYSTRPARSRGNSSVFADFDPTATTTYEQGSIGRQGLSTLSRTRPDIWLPAPSPNPRENASSTSRTFAHAAAPGASPISPNYRDSPANENGRTVSRAGSIRSNERPSPAIDFEAGTSLPRDRFGMGSADSRKGKEPDRSDHQRHPSFTQQTAVHDIYARRSDSRMSMPATPGRPTPAAQTSEDQYFPQYSPVNARYRQGDPEEGEGIPIRSARRSIPSDQGSPENMRYGPAAPASARPIPSKRSYTGDFDAWPPSQPPSSTRPFFGPQSPPTMPMASSSRPIPRPPTSDDDPRRHSPSGVWHGSQSPPNALPFAGQEIPYASSPRYRYSVGSPAGSVSGRRNSNGGRSVRSRSSRQDFWGPADVTQRPLQTFEEQSVASDSDSDAGEDYGMDLEDLWHIRERQELRERQGLTWKLIRQAEEAKRMEEEARRKQEEAARKEEEARQKAEEARRKEEEVRAKETEIRQKQEELLRREVELMRREAEAKIQEERRKREEAEARLQEERRRRQEAEEDARRREAAEAERRAREKQEREERDERERKEREERERREAEERARREREEQERREREERERQARERREKELQEKEEIDRRKREEKEKRQREKEERDRREREEHERRQELERRAREQREKEEWQRRQREDEARLAQEKREWEETRRRDAEAAAAAAAAAQVEAERLRQDMAAAAEAEAQRVWEEQQRREIDAKRQREAEAQRQREAEARVQREAEAEAEAEKMREEEAQRLAEEQREAEAQRQRELEEKKQREAEASRQREAEERRRREAATKQRQETTAKQRQEAEARRQETEARRQETEARRQEVQRAAAEAEAQRRRDAEARQREVEEAQARAAEAERRRTADSESLPVDELPELNDPEFLKEQQAEFERIQAETSRKREEELKRREEEARKREEEKEAQFKREQEEMYKRYSQEQQGRLREQEARRRAEEEMRKKEQQAKEREEAILADVMRRSEEEHRRQEEDRRRKEGERRRQDSVGSGSDANRPKNIYSSASSTAPRPIPNPNVSYPPTASVPGDRSSTASSSSYNSSGSFFSATSARSASTGYTSATGRPSATTTASATPTAMPGTPSSRTGWKSSPSPATPSPTTASSTRSPTGAYHTAYGSGTAYAQSSPSTARPTASYTAASPMNEEEWARRQEEHARKQFEQFQREQEAQQRRAEQKAMRQLSKEDVIRLFEEHERRWTRLTSMDVLTWHSFPWPMLKQPSDPEQLTYIEIQAYVLSPHQLGDKTPKERIKDYLRKWHPDRFETKVLPKVREEEREKVKEGAGAVARHLNKLLSSLSNSAENGLFG